MHDDDVQEVIDALVRQRLESVALAPLAGRALEQLTRDGRHEPVVDEALEGLSHYVRDHGAEMHVRLGMRSPWWLPTTVSTRLVHRLLARTESMLEDMARDRDHPLREQLKAGLVKMAERLQTDDLLRQRGEELKAEFLAQPTVRDFAANVWQDVKADLRTQASEPGSELRARLTQIMSSDRAPVVGQPGAGGGRRTQPGDGHRPGAEQLR